MRKNTIITAVATAGAATLIVSGCSNGSSASDSETTASSSQSLAQFNDADVDYAEGMIMHHEQAVDMSDIMLDKTGIDPDVAKLAKRIKQAQGPEIQQMQSWLKDWNDGGSGHGAHDESMAEGEGMDGMMSPEDLKDLEEADAENASKLFLDQMIEHHEGGVTRGE